LVEIKNLIDSAKNILLVTHENPDEDALCSALAMKMALEKEGRAVDIFCASKVPPNIIFLFEAGQPKYSINISYDLIFGLDYGDIGRLETISAGLDVPEPAITFDHHPLTNQRGQFKIVDPAFSSTCEIVYRFLYANDMAIDKKIATCLLAGIFADTWGFRHSNTTPATLEVVAELLLKGAMINKIARIAYKRNAVSQSKIWSRALAKVSIEKDSGFVFCILGQEDLRECGALPDDVSGLASMLCMIPGIKFSLVLKEFAAGEIDGSLRALPSGGVDVASLARALGGGGHRLSAGFKSRRPAGEVIKQVRDLIKEV